MAETLQETFDRARNTYCNCSVETAKAKYLYEQLQKKEDVAFAAMCLAGRNLAGIL